MIPYEVGYVNEPFLKQITVLDYFIKEYVEVYMDGGDDECAPTNTGEWVDHEGGGREV